MTIKFLGHASFLITSKDRVRIITDPYEPGEQRILAMEPTN